MSERAALPTVSVVMIFLDPGEHFVSAIESVLAQTYRDFELILVDDGSCDGSSDLARSYAARRPELVRYTEHPGHANLGMSASRNLGVACARGRLVSFLDADDIWLPTRLERFVSEIDARPTAGMVYGPTLYWYSWAGTQRTARLGSEGQDRAGKLDLPTHTLLPPPLPLQRWLETAGACLPGMGSLIVRREVYEAVGGFEPSFRGLYEDQVFLAKAALATPMVIIPDILDYYRQHPDSCCARAQESGDYDPVRPHPARHRYLRWLEDYIGRQGVENRALRRALDGQLWPYRSPIHMAIYNQREYAMYLLRETLRSVLPRAAFAQLGPLKRRLKRGES